MRRPRLRLPRALGTASFRLAALYAGLFVVSVAILGVVSLWSIRHALDRQMTDRIEAEIGTLGAIYKSGGIEPLVASVRARERGPAALDYAVEQPAGVRLAGSLPPLPAHGGWMTLADNDGDGDDPVELSDRLRAMVVALPGGVRIGVGDDLSGIDDVEETVLTAFAWVAGLVAALGIGGGVLMSLGFLRRVDAITRAAEAIIAGDLGRRIALRGSNDDLDRLAATLNHMLDRIAALMESLRQVSNDIAHDLRTPLTRLYQGLSTARLQPGDIAFQQQAIEHAITEAEGLLDTFGALLRIAQIEAGSRRAGFRPVDLAELARGVIEVFEPVAEDQSHRLCAAISSVPPIEGDRELLVQALVNLIENALRHTPHDSTVTVTVAEHQGDAELSVSDDGPGVPPPERARILDRFYRREASRTTPGNGLGLALVAAVAELHQAELLVEDAAPGLRVRLRFRSHRRLATGGSGNPSSS